MEEITKIDIKAEDGTLVEADVVTFIKDEQSNKEYVLYSFNDDNDAEEVEIFASIFVKNENGYELHQIEDENEWNTIKEWINNYQENDEE